MAALCAACVCGAAPLDLINAVCGDDALQSPDRITALNGELELARYVNGKRRWRLIRVDIALAELEREKPRILALIHPLRSVMDLNIASVLWFAARAYTLLVGRARPRAVRAHRARRRGAAAATHAPRRRGRTRRRADAARVQRHGAFAEAAKRAMRKRKRKRARAVRREIVKRVKLKVHEACRMREERIKREEHKASEEEEVAWC